MEELKCGLKPQNPGLGQIIFCTTKRQGSRQEENQGSHGVADCLPVKLAVDLCKKLFPIPTTKKPDLVAWNKEGKDVYLVEMTVLHKDSIKAAHKQKENHYQAFVEEGRRNDGQKATPFQDEVGCKGFTTSSVSKQVRVAGHGPKKDKVLMKALQETTQKACHCIWLIKQTRLPGLSHES